MLRGSPSEHMGSTQTQKLKLEKSLLTTSQGQAWSRPQPCPAPVLIQGPSWHLQSSDLGSGKSSSLETKVDAGVCSCSCSMILLPVSSAPTSPLCIFVFSICFSTSISCPWRTGVHFPLRQAGLASTTQQNASLEAVMTQNQPVLQYHKTSARVRAL